MAKKAYLDYVIDNKESPARKEAIEKLINAANTENTENTEHKGESTDNPGVTANLKTISLQRTQITKLENEVD